MNAYGEIAEDEWFRSACLRSSITLFPDEMVVMPNHIQGIIRKNQLDIDTSKGATSSGSFFDRSDAAPLRKI